METVSKCIMFIFGTVFMCYLKLYSTRPYLKILQKILLCEFRRESLYHADEFNVIICYLFEPLHVCTKAMKNIQNVMYLKKITD